MRLPPTDLRLLGFDAGGNHPCDAVLSVLPVLPPVSRPAMRTLNLRTGAPFIVEDTITIEYQTVLNCAAALRSGSDRTTLWTKYVDMHVAIERLTLDQGKAYGDAGFGAAAMTAVTANTNARPRPPPPGPRVISIRNRWVGKSGFGSVCE